MLPETIATTGIFVPSNKPSPGKKMNFINIKAILKLEVVKLDIIYLITYISF